MVIHYACAASAVALFCQVFLCLDAIYEASWGESVQCDGGGVGGAGCAIGAR